MGALPVISGSGSRVNGSVSVTQELCDRNIFEVKPLLDTETYRYIIIKKFLDSIFNRRWEQ
jgi:hypothetical protein